MRIEDFSPVAPDNVQVNHINEANRAYSELAQLILANVDPSAHRTASLRLLLESKMTLIHGITHPSVT